MNPLLTDPPTVMEVHPYCSIFPPMSDEEFDGLVDSIKKSGLLEAIVTFEGKILDGRNRFAACEKAGVRPHFIACPEADPLDYVEAKNLNRRHLSASQRAFAAAKLTGMKRGVNQFTKEDGGHPPSSVITSAEAARRGHVDRATITEARAVSEKGVPELHKEVEKGAVTVHAASKFATLPPEEQKAIAAQGPEAIIAKAKEIKQEAKAAAHAEPSSEYAPSEPDAMDREEPLVTSGPHPTTVEPLSEEARRAGREAAKDTEKLWLLKRAWKQAAKKDRSAFVQWLERTGEIAARFDAGAMLIPADAPSKRMSYRPNQGMQIFQQARATIDRISRDDAEAEQALRALIAHCESMLTKLK